MNVSPRALITVRMIIAAAWAVGVAGDARAQTTSADSAKATKATHALDTTIVTTRASDLVGTATSANQGTVGAADLALRPLLRPGETVENVPGVIVTQHSGSGKANQYFLRGFNLDHGTDLAISVDGVPVNMPSHAHGQGYADLNFLMPELVARVDYEKGPYYADVGDFGSAGAFAIHYFDRLPAGLALADAGPFGYARLLAANNVALLGGNLIYAGAYEHNDGPWTIGDNEQKYDGILRFSEGNAERGLNVTLSAYHNSWRSTDQVPDRAIASGLISEWGEIDTTDAGNTGRYAVSADWHTRNANTATRIAVFAKRYDLDLFSNFTYFLNDPVHGDQIEQQDDRAVLGATASRAWIGTWFGAQSQTTVGVQLRNDEIRNGLYHTEARVRLNTVTSDDIGETSAAPYVETRTWWTSWLRTVAGFRADVFWLGVHNIAGGSGGRVQASLPSPKLNLIFGPWDGTELYASGGYGFHSNDARGVVAAADPATALARSVGAEIGARTTVVRGLQSSLSLWVLDLKSELVWDGDAGGNTPSGPTRRYGVEFANYYTPISSLTIDADYAWSHARFTDSEPEGSYVPEALVATFDGGLAVHDIAGALRKFSAGLRVRYIGPRPLTQNDSVSSPATTLVYADVSYELNDRWRIGLDVFNVLNTRASDIDYFYTSRLPGEPLAGVADVHTHPAEPRELRLSIRVRP
jgi:hypothetical protein